MKKPLVIASPKEMRDFARTKQAQSMRIALVPTMGFLHQGHLSLVEKAKSLADTVLVSIFVNPTQFAPNEDLDEYPRDLEGDLQKLVPYNVDAVFAPSVHNIYANHFDTYVTPEHMAQTLCGAFRPTHFRGVATIVLLLFRITLCNVAVFGRKDFQQLQIIRRMAKDLWLDVDVVGMPIVRENDGLAMSSRNAYLSPKERQAARVLNKTLDLVQSLFEKGEHLTEALLQKAKDSLGKEPLAQIDYVNIVDANTLAPITSVEEDALCALAVHVGKTRLIDNCVLSP